MMHGENLIVESIHVPSKLKLADYETTSIMHVYNT